MNIELALGKKTLDAELILVGAFSSGSKDKKTLNASKWRKEIKDCFDLYKAGKNFTGEKGQSFTFYTESDQTVLAFGLGDKKSFDAEKLRRAVATMLKTAKSLKFKEAAIDIDSIAVGNLDKSVLIASEAIGLADYNFDHYKSNKSKTTLAKVQLCSKNKSVKAKKMLSESESITDSINKIRDFVNLGPNDLNSETYSKMVDDDIKKNLKGKGVRVKILGKKELKKEKMGLFLSVNAGSGYDPRLVHLTYTPKKVTKNTKHVVLVGKGLTFDTGGYSLKPSTAMAGMKFDMGGSATVYGAFRAAALLGVNAKVTCILGMTDNAVNSFATMPDSVIKARNGKTVEILNTDAEGRLVLADCLDYACDLKPDFLMDAATLTGACLVALGTEVCGLMSNDQKFADKLLKSAKSSDEQLWQLPIIEEWAENMKSDIADLRNIGRSNYAGTPKAAAFLQEFVREGVSWAHFDVAGVADSASHLPYCPKTGGSGLIVRTMVDFIRNV